MKSLFVYVASGGTKTVDQTPGGEPITGRDMIALLATIGIDLGLLVLALLDPPSSGPIRRDGLSNVQARLHEPDKVVVQQLTEAIQTAMGRAPGVDLEWIHRHFIHHNGASYLIIPNLYNVDQKNKDEELKALAMNQLAGVFADLGLVRALSPKELKKFGEEEMRDSFSDLTRYMAARDDDSQKAPAGKTGIGGRIVGRIRGVDPVSGKAEGRMRNHGLLSKAQRALDIANWSREAQSDVELFRLVDIDGLTPLLIVMSKGKLTAPVDGASAPAGVTAGGSAPAVTDGRPTA